MNDLYILGSVGAILLIATVLFFVLRKKSSSSVDAESKNKNQPITDFQKTEELPPVEKPKLDVHAKAKEKEKVAVAVSPSAAEEAVVEKAATSKPVAEEVVADKAVAKEFVVKESATEKVDDAEELVDAIAEPEPELKSLDQAMEKTRKGFIGRIKGLFSGGQSLSPDEFDELEEILYTSDLGPQTVQRLMDAIDEKLSGKEKSDFDSVRGALKEEMSEIFAPFTDHNAIQRWTSHKEMMVLMVVGVNGAGKTTTIGKVASQLSQAGKKVMVAAGDTFRAAADSQLKVWSERAQVEIFSPPNVKDPSAVAYDAVKKAEASGVDVLIVDTAGRLHTQVNLMEELKKMKRVLEKAKPGAPDEVLLVLDANSGQNALIQAKSFNEALEVNGVILTKLDGTAKGGVAVGVACELHLPICLIGVGESLADLRPFSAGDFVDSIL